MENKTIGVFPMFNTGDICVHEIDHAEDRVFASMNGENPECIRLRKSRSRRWSGMAMRWSRAFCSAPFLCRSLRSCACEGGLHESNS